MSTLAYGVMTAARTEAASTSAEASAPKGVGTYVDILAALIPAEVLVAHSVILTITTKASIDKDGQSIVTITHQDGLTAAFWVLLALGPFIYLVGRLSVAGAKKWDWRWDSVRMLIPAIAFVGWMMIQSGTAIDAVVDWSMDSRKLAAALGSPFVSVIAGALSVAAKKA